ncbi:MAG: hypothetical protein H7833_06340 [Magnetococcus sp. DMHC-1]
MYTCQHRAHDLHRKPVVGLAILADEEPGWRVSEYRQVQWGSELVYRFNTVKLLDYLDKLSELESSNNPFAIVTLVHLTGKQTKSQPAERFQQKKRITRMLYERGFNRQQIVDLFRFIDWVLSLPEELDNQFWVNLSHFEENKKMPYITSCEFRYPGSTIPRISRSCCRVSWREFSVRLFLNFPVSCSAVSPNSRTADPWLLS